MLRPEGWVVFGTNNIRPLPITQDRTGLKFRPAGQPLVSLGVGVIIHTRQECGVGDIPDHTIGADIRQVAPSPEDSIVCHPPSAEVGFQLQNACK